MEKKTKLTISGTAKKTFNNIEIAKTQGKKTVVIEKQTSKFPNKADLLDQVLSNQKLLLHLIEVLLQNHHLPLNHPQYQMILKEES